MGGPPVLMAGRKLRVQEFLTSGSWKRPAGVDAVWLFLVGGGGGGGGGQTAFGGAVTAASGCGGGGEVKERLVSVASIPVGASVVVTIGAGGVAGAQSTTASSCGGRGGDTKFGSLLTALGGGGGHGFGGTATYVASPGATTGGAALCTSGYNQFGTIWRWGLGGGAGGHADGGTIGSPNGNGYGPVPSALNEASVPAGRGLQAAAKAENTGSPAYISYYVQVPAKPGPGRNGFGGGGGPGATDGGSTTKSAPAAANTGGGGCGGATDASGDIGWSGSAGGTGYGLVAWWE